MLTIKEIFWTYASVGFSAVSSLLLVRLFGVESRCEFAVLFASLSTAISIGTYHTLEASALLKRHTPSLKKAILLSLILATLGITYCIPHLHKITFLLVASVAGWTLTSVISSSQLGILKGSGDVSGIGIIRATFTFVSLIGLIIISYFINDLDGILISYVIGNIATVIAGMFLIKNKIYPKQLNLNRSEDVPKSLIALALINSILINLEPLLGTFIASMSDLGRYMVARSLFSIATPVATALASKFYHASISRNSIWKSFFSKLSTYFVVLLLISITLIFFEDELAKILKLSEPIGIALTIFAALISLAQVAAMWTDEIFKGRKNYKELSLSGAFIIAIAICALPWLTGLVGILTLGLIASCGRSLAIAASSRCRTDR